MAKLRMDGDAFATAASNCGSAASSWMSDLSLGSEGDQSLHSFSQSRSQQGEALADPGADLGLCSGGNSEGDGEGGGGDKGAPTKDRLRKLPPSMAKTNIQILGAPGSFSPFRSTISVHPCVVVRPIAMQDMIVSSPTKTISPPPASGEMGFEDPWLKRGSEEGRAKELGSEATLQAEPPKRLVGSGDHQRDGKQATNGRR